MWHSLQLGELLSFSISPFETMIRGTAIFWTLFLIFRFLLRRDIGNVGISDFLLVVIVADASQNAMTGEGKSLLDGMLLIFTLVFWNYLTDYLGYTIPALRRFMEPPSIVLFRDGDMHWRNLRREFITKQELLAKLRENGMADFSGVKEMRLEADGEISVIPIEKIKD